MTRSRLKLIVSIFVVLSHVAVFFTVIWLQSRFALEQSDIFVVLAAFIPLFGVFTTVIVKDTLKGQANNTTGPKMSAQMISITFIILIAYAMAVAMTFKLFVDQVILTAEDLAKWTAAIESGFGVTLGMIVDDLFGGQTGPEHHGAKKKTTALE